MLNKQDLFPIGIGTWGIGGYAERDPSINESKQIKALTYMLDNGFNFIEANFTYSQGYSVEILAKALQNSSKKREDIFICQAIYLNNNKGIEKADNEVRKALELFETDYIDTIQFSQGSFLVAGFKPIVNFVKQKLSTGKTRFTSITNEDLGLLKKYHQRFGDKLFSHEVPFNLEVKVYDELGIIPYAEQNDILTVVYQPIRRNRTALRNWPLLIELSKKYGATQNQILMNWIVSKGYLPLTKSETISHIDEHLATLNIKLKAEDIKRLNEFTPPGYIPSKIDWDKSGDGVRVDQLSNVFDEEYDKQINSKKSV